MKNELKQKTFRKMFEENNRDKEGEIEQTKESQQEKKIVKINENSEDVTETEADIQVQIVET